MTTRTHCCLTHTIRRLLHRPVVACSSAQKHTASTALLSILLLNQPGLVEAQQVQAKFVEVKRLDNPLAPPIDVGGNAKPAFADIDNDGDFDVFIGAEDGTVKYYENTGNVNHPIFDERTDENNSLSEVSIGNRSRPTLVDIDNDNDLDAFIGGKNGAIRYYENTGTVSKPTFVEHTEEKNPLNSVIGSENFPSFVDIDNDGDFDFFIGTTESIEDEETQTRTSYGIVKFFENTGNLKAPIFEERPETTYPFSRVKDAENSTPHFVDIDDDGDMDALIGSSDGTVKYYENTGNANFEQRTEGKNPLKDVNVGNSSAPALIDIDGDSDLDAFIGTGDGTVKYYENIGSSKEPSFVERTKLENPFGGVVDNDISLTMADIDNDGDTDAFIANSSEPIKYYENVGNVNKSRFVENIEQNPFNGIETVSSDIISLVDINSDGYLDAFLVNRAEVPDEYDGTSTIYLIKYYENTGSANQPSFEERIDDANPLNSVRKEDNSISKFYFIDADRDRDFDVFIDDDYYENTGSINHPFFVKRLEQDNPLRKVSIGDDDSTPILIDVDNDGNLDAFVSTSEGTIRYYEDRGSSELDFRERKEEQNPFVNVVNVENSIPILVDLDNDGDMDAFIKSSDKIKYYLNESNVNQPAFEPNRQNNPFTEINRLFSKPALADIDNDGDLDVAIGTYEGTVKYYENTGTISQATFVERTNQDNPFFNINVGNFSTLALADIDNDSDLDAFIGNAEGTVSYYQNQGSVNKSRFVEHNKVDNPLEEVNVGGFSQVTLVDIDNDSDLDAFIGSEYGHIQYYENVGNISQPSFVKLTETANPLAEASTTNVENDERFSTLSLVDIDGDKDLDAFIATTNFSEGLSNSQVKYYENVGTTSEPLFTVRTEQHIFLGDSDLFFAWPTLVDIDNDSDLDAFIGSGWSGIKYYENTGTINKPNFIMRLEQDNSLEILNGYIVSPPSLVDIDNDNDVDAFFGLSNGKVRYYENTGTISFPVFVEQKQNNALIGVDVEDTSQPMLVDIDKDEDLDAFIGAEDGTVRYYENTGTVRRPRFIEKKGQKNPLANAKVESFSRPVLGDIDNDGDLDAFINGIIILENDEREFDEVISIIRYYENVGTESHPSFLERSEQEHSYPRLERMGQEIPIDSFRDYSRDYSRYFSSVSLADFNNDENIDILVVVGIYVEEYKEILDKEIFYFENIGTTGKPFFVDSSIIPFDDRYFGNDLTFVNLDNDGDLDAFTTIGGAVYYYENTSLIGNALPDNYALPKGRVYNNSRQISLNCLNKCEKIYYTLDGTTPTKGSKEYNSNAPFEIETNTTVRFITVDAEGNSSYGQPETYTIDSDAPTIEITSPKNEENIDGIVSIEGTVNFEAEGETGLDRIELLMTDGTYYLTNKDNTPYEKSLTWIPIYFSDNNWSYDIDAAILPPGKYPITVRAFDNAGNVGEDTITVRIGLAFTTLSINLNSSAILQDKPVELTGKLYRWPALETDLSDLPIILTITPPTGDSWQKQTVTNHLGEYKFDVSSFAHKGTYQLQVTFAGNEKFEPSESKVNELSVGTSAGYAILIQGKVNNEEGLKPHHKTLDRVYKQLKERNFKDENILSFNHNKANQTFNYEPNQINTDNEYKPSKSSIQVAIENWAKDRLIGSPAPLYIIMVDHGDWEQFILNGTEDVITPAELDTWLDTLENSLADSPLNPLEEPRVIIIGACFSGSFIPSLSKLDGNRVIITSARENEFSYKGPQEADGIRSGEYFIDALFQQLGRGEPFKLAFEKATNSTELFTYSGAQEFANNINNPKLLDQAVQHPLLDDNGDGKGSNVLYANTGDGQKIDKRRLGVGLDYNANAVSNPVAVKAMTETQYLDSNETSALLWLKATGNVGISIMEIRRPVVIDTITHQSRITEQVELDLPKRFPTFNRNTANYEYTYQNFDEPGRYQIFYYVHAQAILDPETGDSISLGDISPVKHSIVYKDRVGNQAPEASTLLYPSDGASTRTDLGFYGESASDPDDDPVTYTLLIATDSDDLDDSVFDDSVVYKQEELRIPTTYIDRNTIINDGRADGTTGLKDLTTYYWKFETIDNFGARTSSEIFSFETDNATNDSYTSDDNTCDGTLGALPLQVVARVVSEEIWYIGTLQPCDGIYTAENVQAYDSKPNAKVTAYYCPNSTLLDITDKHIVTELIPDEPLPLRFKKLTDAKRCK